MKKALITIYLIAFLVASSGSGIYFAATTAVKPTPRVYLPYVFKSGFTSLLIRGYVSDFTTPSGSSPALPNLLPYAPVNWTYPVVPASSQGVLQATSLVAGTGNYFNWAVLNEGNSMATGRIYTCLYLDGAEIGRWHGDNQPKRSYAFYTDFSFPVLSGGTHTVKIQADCTNAIAEANENDNTWQRTFTWQVPILVSGQHGFDACTAPSLTQMRAWWQHSPYFDVNIYFGGISRACTQPNLNAAWVQSVNSMGWRLIPTWVGPQAPCWRYYHPMSSNASTAYTQGRSEADKAHTAAQQLGLSIPNQSGTVIYYDMEYFPTTNLSCLQAVQSFINGWVGRLHELGNRAGVYSNPSVLTHFANLTNSPDDIWAAWWKTPPYYDPTVNVWNLPSISNALWANHQRIRQYAGGHNETWGGITINIDSNVLDGHVAGTVPDPATDGMASQSATLSSVGPHTLGLDLLTSREGWVLTEDRVLWTADSGETWRDISPVQGHSATLSTANFITPQNGWVVAATPATPESQEAWQVFTTQDGGEHWDASILPTGLTADNASTVNASLHFIDPQHGWVVLHQASSSNFHPGRLFRTQDGGTTWQETNIPIGEAVAFLTPQIGFTAGGAGGNEFYRTADGGVSWQPQDIAQDLAAGETAQYSLPIRKDDQIAELSVIILSETNPRLEHYITRDGGKSWERLPSQPNQDYLLANSLAGRSIVTITTAQQAAGQSLPEGTFQADFSDSLNGWALSTSGNCQGQKGSEPLQCNLQTRMWGTQDGGATWIEIHLPEK